MIAQDDAASDVPRPQPEQRVQVTARMRRLRELIEQGEYPDRDELAEKIVDAVTGSGPVT